MQITYSDNIASWEYKNQTVEIKLSKILHAKYEENENIIIVSCGENFISKNFFYYSLAGKLLGQQDLEAGTIEWNYDGLHKLEFQFVNSIVFSPINKLIFSIYRQSKDRGSVSKLEIYNFESKQVYQIDSPKGYTMIYITEIGNEKVRVACEAIDRENYDSYGRSRFHFTLNLKDQKWAKDGLAY